MTNTHDEAVTEPEFLLDSDGYPTDAALEYLDRFDGAPQEYVEFVSSMWVNGSVSVEPGKRWGTPTKIISFVTGGWSGNETISGRMDRTMFSFAYWAKSERGGLEVFEIPESRWNETQFLGKTRCLAEQNDPRRGFYPTRLRTVDTAELRLIIDTMDDDHYDAARENLVLLTKRLETETEVG